MKSIALVAVAGLASVASAQSLSLNLSFDKTSIGIGETATATITASFAGASTWINTHVNLVAFSAIASGNFVATSGVAAVSWNFGGLGFDGQGDASGADVLGIEAAQTTLFGPPVVQTNPISITSFTVTGTAEGVLSYSALSTNPNGDAFSLGGLNSTTFLPIFASFGSDAFSSGSLAVTPAPSAMALLGLGGLVAGRRRR